MRCLLKSYLDNIETSHRVIKRPQTLVATEFTTDFIHILDKYEKQKENTYKVLELVGSNYVFENYGSDVHNRLYGTILNCGTQLQFTKTNENGAAVYHLTGANFCRQRICPMCQFRRAEKLFIQMFNVVKHLEGQYRFLHLVLTIPNCDTGGELVEGIKLLYASFSKFYKYKEVKQAFKGCLRCLEISYNYENNSFHPHLHCLIAVNNSYFNDTRVYLSYDKIRQLWTKACKADKPLQIYIRACKVGDYEGVAEVCKYSVKPLDLTKSDNDIQNLTIVMTLFHTLKGMRFLQKYGVIKSTFSELYGCNDDEYVDDIRNGEHRRLFFRWDGAKMGYRKVDDN